MRSGSVHLRDSCPECGYEPRSQEQVHYWEAEVAIGSVFGVECPGCGNEFVFGIDPPDGSTLPAAAELLDIVERLDL